MAFQTISALIARLTRNSYLLTLFSIETTGKWELKPIQHTLIVSLPFWLKT